MALSRVERIKQEREQLIQEMEGKNKGPNKGKILTTILALILTAVVVFFGVKLLMDDKNTDKKAEEGKGKPTIQFEDPYIEITAGESLDITAGIILSDDKDSAATLKRSLEVKSTPEFDANKEASYSVKYTITDSNNNTVSKTRTIIVASAAKTEEAKMVVANPSVEIEVGSNYDLKEGLTIENGDKSLLDQLTITSSPTFNNNKAGEYTITYTVKDKNGKELKATKKVTVKSKTTTTTPTNPAASNDKEAPIIWFNNSKDLEINVGTKINLAELVSKTTDNVDANHEVLATLKIKSDPVFSSDKAGTYKVTYTVQDKAGNTSSKVKTIIVK